MVFYLCINKMIVEPLKERAMNTETTIATMNLAFSSEASYRTLMDLINDMDLEIMDISMN